MNIVRQVRHYKRAFQTLGDAVGDGPKEEGCPLGKRRRNQAQQQRRHGRPFGVEHPVGIAKALFAARRRDQPAGAILGHQIIYDGAGLGDNPAAIGNNRRFAERVDLLQLGRRQQGLLVALVGDDLVGQPKLFEQPQNALRA